MRQTISGNIHMTLTPFEKRLPLYLTCVGGWEHQYPIEREQGWPDFQWLQCVAGQGLLRIQEREHVLRAGEGALLFPHERHAYYATSDPWSVRWFSFNGGQAADMLTSLQFKHSTVLRLSNPDPMLARIDDLQAAASADTSSDHADYLACSALLYRTLLDLYAFGSLPDSRSPYQTFSQLSPALHYMEEHFQETISLKDIAAQLGVSEYHTCVLFRQSLDMRPFEYLNKIRIRKARLLLSTKPELGIADVARLVGYESESYFIRQFKRIQHVTPNKYRLRFRPRD